MSTFALGCAILDGVIALILLCFLVDDLRRPFRTLRERIAAARVKRRGDAVVKAVVSESVVKGAEIAKRCASTSTAAEVTVIDTPEWKLVAQHRGGLIPWMLLATVKATGTSHSFSCEAFADVVAEFERRAAVGSFAGIIHEALRCEVPEDQIRDDLGKSAIVEVCRSCDIGNLGHMQALVGRSML